MGFTLPFQDWSEDAIWEKENTEKERPKEPPKKTSSVDVKGTQVLPKEV